jgi:hypothetical protein
VPGDDRLGSDHDQMTPPLVTGTTGDGPDELVAPAKTGSLARRASQDGELVAHERVLDDEVAAAA